MKIAKALLIITALCSIIFMTASSQQPLSPKAVLKGPQMASGSQGSRFRLEIGIEGLENTSAKGLEITISLGGGLDVLGIDMPGIDSNLTPQWNTDDQGCLRIALLNTGGEGLTIFSPEKMLVLNMETETSSLSGTKREISISRLRILYSSLDTQDIAVDGAKTRVEFTEPIEGLKVKVKTVYTGSGDELIEESQKCILFVFDGLSPNSGVNILERELYYSDELTNGGSPAFLAIMQDEDDYNYLLDPDHYLVFSQAASVVRFADLNHDGTEPNAQSALDILSLWLRKRALASDLDILSANVTADGKIDPSDALAVLEYFVNGIAFPICSAL